MTHPQLRSRRTNLRRSSRRRQGAILVVALVCLIVVVSLIGIMLQSALRAHRQLQAEHDLHQVELLLQAGANRAAYRLQHDPGYRNETWQPTADHLSGPAQVTIEITHNADSDPWNVQIVAEYPYGSPRSVRRSQAIQFPPDTHVNQE